MEWQTWEELDEAVMNCPDKYIAEPIERSIDWGRPRSQGKRSGGMVKGSMSAALRGVKIYRGFNYFINLPDYEQIKPDIKFIHSPYRYKKARDYGLDHEIARVFSGWPDIAYQRLVEKGAARSDTYNN
jgi:hypothetical protein